MKKFISISLLAIGFTFTSFAQNGKARGKQEQKSPEERATHRTERLTKELSLSADQAAKVKALLLQQNQEIEALRTKYASATDKSAERTERKALHEKGETDLKAILTADQITQYEASKKDGKGDRGGRPQGGGGRKGAHEGHNH